jgi:hemolysin III
MAMGNAYQFPSYSVAEQRADAAVHIIGVSVAIIATTWLLWQAAHLEVAFSLAVYGLGLITMLVVSALYNLTPASRLKELFRRADHATIYVMIAGTYTPFAMHRLDGAVGIAIGVSVWLAAALGIVLALGYPRRFEAFKVILYLVMGWMILPGIIPFYHSVTPTALWLLAAGGIIYSLGLGIYLLRRLSFNNALWHAMVLSAAGLHFSAMVIEFVR